MLDKKLSFDVGFSIGTVLTAVGWFTWFGWIPFQEPGQGIWWIFGGLLIIFMVCISEDPKETEKNA